MHKIALLESEHQKGETESDGRSVRPCGVNTLEKGRVRESCNQRL